MRTHGRPFGGPGDGDMRAALRNGHAVRAACEARGADMDGRVDVTQVDAVRVAAP